MLITRSYLADYLTHQVSHYLTYLMLIWLLFDDNWMIIVVTWVINICKNMQSEWLTQICISQAMQFQNTGGQACTSSEGNLWFAWFITANFCKVCTLLWPNSQQTKEQKANPTIFKARIVNRRDNFILVDKIVRQNVLKGLSLRRISIRKQINSRSSRL